MASGTIPSHIPKLRNSWIIHAATDPVLAPDYWMIASAVLWVEIVFVPGPRITLSHISPQLRHRKKYENMIYSSGLAPSRTKLGLATQM